MLILDQVSFRYGKTTILKNISTKIPNTALCIGPNGCGKTTLLKLIAGLLPPDNGRILLNDNIDFSASLCFNDRILFQDLPVEQHFQWVRQHANLSSQRLSEHIAQFQCEPLLAKCPITLSQGQRQWISLALACLMPADILLLDEPFQHLDTEKTTLLCRLLSQMAATGTRFLITTHTVYPAFDFPIWHFPTP